VNVDRVFPGVVVGAVPFACLRLSADTIIDLFPKKLWEKTASLGEGRENLNHFCLAVTRTEWEGHIKRLEARSIPVERGPVRLWGAQGIGTSIYFRDPEKNLIEVRHYEAETDEQERGS
jgi:extradiol dioxygenase family protein